MGNEFWKQIPGYGEHYEASSHGRIRVKDRIIIKKHPMTGKYLENRYKSKVLTPAKSDKWGHMGVTLGVDGKDYSVSVHKLVLLAFVGEKPEGYEACHNNGIASDNRPENLRWDTHFSNNQDRKFHGNYSIGESHPMAKLTTESVVEIRNTKARVKDICDKYGMSRSTAHRVISGKTWGHIK